MRKTSLNCMRAMLRPAVQLARHQLQATALHLHDMWVAEVAVVDNLPLHVLGDGAVASGNELDGHLQAPVVSLVTSALPCCASGRPDACLPGGLQVEGELHRHSTGHDRA